jgi:hypothetical protein
VMVWKIGNGQTGWRRAVGTARRPPHRDSGDPLQDVAETEQELAGTNQRPAPFERAQLSSAGPKLGSIRSGP